MAARRRGKVKYGNAINLSFTLDELNENASIVAIDRVSMDGRRIYRQTQHVAPSPKKQRLEYPQDLQDEDNGRSAFDFDISEDPVDVNSDEEEKIKPRAKRYLSSVFLLHFLNV